MNQIVCLIPNGSSCSDGPNNVIREDTLIGWEHKQNHHNVSWYKGEHKTVTIHRESMVDPMDEEVISEYGCIIRKPVVFTVEEESVEQVLI